MSIDKLINLDNIEVYLMQPILFMCGKLFWIVKDSNLIQFHFIVINNNLHRTISFQVTNFICQEIDNLIYYQTRNKFINEVI